MNQVNFLPQSFHALRRKRRRVRLEVVLVSAVGTLVLASFIGVQGTAFVKSRIAAKVEADALKAHGVVDEVEVLRRQEADLRDRIAMTDALAEPVEQTQVIATVGQLAPNSVTLFKMSIQANRNPLPGNVVEVENPRARKKKKDEKPEPAPRQYLRLVVEGVSANDHDIATFVGALEAHPLFRTVNLHYRGPIEFSHYSGRRFHLSAEVSLDYEYKPMAEKPTGDRKELADAN